MPKNLVICESPGKIQKISHFLGGDYQVMASFGHVIDLPEKSFGVDIKKDFEPTFTVKDGKQHILDEIVKAAKKSDKVFLLTDPDREGTGIAFHLKSHLADKQVKAKIYRSVTSEITKQGVLSAIANCGEIDTNTVDAYLCRRLLDRIVGFRTSFLTQQATGGRSAGRVQSAMLRILVDREKEIQQFVPEEYWVLTANLSNSKQQPYVAILSDKIHVPNETIATEIYNKVVNGHPVVSEVEIKQVNVNPFAPFTTIPMQATASTLWGWSASKTMKIAQNLFETSLITYHRSDSTTMSKEATDMVRAFLIKNYDTKYIPAKTPIYSSKKGAQEAHEACRVTDVNNKHPASGDEQKLYHLIWKRTVASQMTPGLDERIKATTKISGYDFISRGHRILFDGFRSVWDVSHSQDVVLPELFKDEKCTLKSLEKEQKFTTPPSRYSVASLGKKCEDSQISRPSTFSNFIETLADRKYITKNKNSFQPTELGIRVIDFLVASNFCFVDIAFTAAMEDLLDEIQSATKNKTAVLSAFWERLKKDIDNSKVVKQQKEITDKKCPSCQGKLLCKHSKYGAFFVCEFNKKKDKKCDFLANVGTDGEPQIKEKKPKEYSTISCTKCNKPMVKRTSKFGEFLGCQNFPKCKVIMDVDGNVVEKKKSKFNKFKSKSTK